MNVTGACVCSKADFLRGVHQPGDKYMIALYSPTAAISCHIEEYAKTGEVTGKGYSAGGVALSGYSVDMEGTAAVLQWTAPVIWQNATITARYGLIYNASKNNRAIMVIDVMDEREQPVTSTNGKFQIDGGVGYVLG